MLPYTIEQGRVHVNAVTRMIDHDDVVVFELDLAAKRAQVGAYGLGAGQVTVWLVATDDTLHLDESAGRDTEFVVEVPDQGWRAVAEIARYTAQVVVYRADPAAYDDHRTDEPVRVGTGQEG